MDLSPVMDLSPQSRREAFDSYIASHVDGEPFPEWFAILCVLESLEAMKRAEAEIEELL